MHRVGRFVLRRIDRGNPLGSWRRKSLLQALTQRDFHWLIHGRGLFGHLEENYFHAASAEGGDFAPESRDDVVHALFGKRIVKLGEAALGQLVEKIGCDARLSRGGLRLRAVRWERGAQQHMLWLAGLLQGRSLAA